MSEAPNLTTQLSRAVWMDRELRRLVLLISSNPRREKSTGGHTEFAFVLIAIIRELRPLIKTISHRIDGRRINPYIKEAEKADIDCSLPHRKATSSRIHDNLSRLPDQAITALLDGLDRAAEELEQSDRTDEQSIHGVKQIATEPELAPRTQHPPKPKTPCLIAWQTPNSGYAWIICAPLS